jgi:hypothetical protein
MLKRAAKQCARDAKKWGIPLRKLSAERVADGEKGFCGHVDVSRAFPADKGTHTDPGVNFPWAQFIALVKAEMEPAKPATPPKENSMALDAGDKQWITKEIKTLLTDLTNQSTGGGLKSGAGAAVLSHGWPLKEGEMRTPHWANLQEMYRVSKENGQKLDALLALLEPAPEEPPAPPA